MNLALVDPQNSVNRIQSDTLIDPAVQTKIGWRWLPVETVGGGSYDPETQVLEGPVYSVQVAKVVETFTIRTKTQTELDADKDAKASAINDVIFRVLFNHETRIRSLTGQPSITQAQFHAAVRALL